MLKLTSLSLSYGTGLDEQPVIHDLTLSLNRAEILGILGVSGCGKTTLLQACAGFIQPISGSLSFNGEAPDLSRHAIHLLSQEHSLFPWKNLEANVSLPQVISGKKDKAKVQKYFDLLGIAGLEKSFPHEVSGGEAQRAALARALVAAPELLLLDEPFSALDVLKRPALSFTLKTLLKDAGITTAVVTHNMAEALYLADKLLILTAYPQSHFYLDNPWAGKSVVFDVHKAKPNEQHELYEWQTKLMQLMLGEA